MSKLLRSFLKWVRSCLFSLLKRSLKTHASINVANLDESRRFYKQLGFRQVTSTRGGEVVLLRNHRGDELNLVPLSPHSASAGERAPTSVSLEVDDLDQDLVQLQSWHPDLHIKRDATSRYVTLLDPDSNSIELFQTLALDKRPAKAIYHIATPEELQSGLSEQYYLPPEGEYRFVRCAAHSSYAALACRHIADETQTTPLVIEMDQHQLSIAEEWVDADMDAKRAPRIPTFPHVHSPIQRQAIISVGESFNTEGGYTWPEQFVTLDKWQVNI